MYIYNAIKYIYLVTIQFLSNYNSFWLLIALFCQLCNVLKNVSSLD